MRGERLRPAYSETALAELYARPHDSSGWADHRLRVAVTIQVAAALGTPYTAADLSCGDGVILRSLTVHGRRYFGDVAPGYDITGPIGETLGQIPAVDLLVCCETIEHLDTPAAVLTAARGKAKALVLSTPVGAWADSNPEHYWAWDREFVEGMLSNAGWRVLVYCELDTRPAGGEYCYGIWGCK